MLLPKKKPDLEAESTGAVAAGGWSGSEGNEGRGGGGRVTHSCKGLLVSAMAAFPSFVWPSPNEQVAESGGQAQRRETFAQRRCRSAAFQKPQPQIQPSEDLWSLSYNTDPEQ